MFHVLYFAYGSNLDHEQIKSRCPGSEYLFRAKLPGYRLLFDGHSERRGCSVANIVQDLEGHVWGGVFRMTDEDLVQLDKYENHPHSYKRSVVKVTDDHGKEHDVLAYHRLHDKEGKPNKRYIQHIINGAKHCGLPEEYITKLLSLFPSQEKD